MSAVRLPLFRPWDGTLDQPQPAETNLRITSEASSVDTSSPVTVASLRRADRSTPAGSAHPPKSRAVETFEISVSYSASSDTKRDSTCRTTINEKSETDCLNTSATNLPGSANNVCANETEPNLPKELGRTCAVISADFMRENTYEPSSERQECQKDYRKSHCHPVFPSVSVASPADICSNESPVARPADGVTPVALPVSPLHPWPPPGAGAGAGAACLGRWLAAPPPLAWSALQLLVEEQRRKSDYKRRRHRKFTCPKCPMTFSNKGQLTGHYRKHTGERPFECVTCHKKFTRNEELTRHSRIHTGDRPFACLVCGKRFGRKDHLNKHQRTHAMPLYSAYGPVTSPVASVLRPLAFGPGTDPRHILL